MIIKKYDLYNLNYKKSSFMDFSFQDDLYSITKFLKEIYPLDSALWYQTFIKQFQVFSQIGLFTEVEISLDEKNSLIYISDASENDYRFREANVTSTTIIEYCKNGSIEYNVMTKNNFINLISSWVNLLEKKPPFILLYQDDNDWYDLKSFSAEQDMKQFVSNHIKKINL